MLVLLDPDPGENRLPNASAEGLAGGTGLGVAEALDGSPKDAPEAPEAVELVLE